MQKDDTSKLLALHDIPAALGLLSRLPVPVDMDRATARGAQAAWAYPVAGLTLGGLAAMTAQIALWMGLPAVLAAGLALVVLVVLTGAMHEDGLADAADGLWGGWDTDRRLEIMKDSRIGAYGVIALALGLGLRWQGLSIAATHGALWPALLATAVMSRAAMPPLMARLPQARPNGLSGQVGQPSVLTARIGEVIALLAALLCFGLSGIWLIIVWLLATVACAGIAKAKIGGQTGDILGATQQVVEISLLLVIATLVTHGA